MKQEVITHAYGHLVKEREGNEEMGGQQGTSGWNGVNSHLSHPKSADYSAICLEELTIPDSVFRVSQTQPSPSCSPSWEIYQPGVQE